MKLMIILPLVSIFGLLVAVFLSTLFIGFENTFASINYFFAQFDPPNNHSKIFKGNLENMQNFNTIVSNSIKKTNSYSFELTYPFLVPTNGIANSQFHLYSANHDGIDIWTNIEGKGINGSKGNPVYSACTGTVIRVFRPNEEIEIECEKLPLSYKNLVPSLHVKALYSHLGDGQTGESFHNLRIGQKVDKGELLGYQGNKSSFAPENRITHLHFGIYDLTKSNRPSLNPEPYIGVSATIFRQIFITNN